MVLAEKTTVTDYGKYHIRLCWNPTTDSCAIYVHDENTGEPVTSLEGNREEAAFAYTHPVLSFQLV